MSETVHHSEIQRTRKVSQRRSKEFSMDDLRHRLDAQDSVIQAIRGDMTLQATASRGVQENLAQLSGGVNAILQLLGEEKEDGQGNYLGTGLLGRVRRVERAQRSLRELYHRWIAFGAGFSFCLTASVAFVYWLLQGHFSLVTKIVSGG